MYFGCRLIANFGLLCPPLICYWKQNDKRLCTKQSILFFYIVNFIQKIKICCLFNCAFIASPKIHVLLQTTTVKGGYVPIIIAPIFFRWSLKKHCKWKRSLSMIRCRNFSKFHLWWNCSFFFRKRLESPPVHFRLLGCDLRLSFRSTTKILFFGKITIHFSVQSFPTAGNVLIREPKQAITQ